MRWKSKDGTKIYIIFCWEFIWSSNVLKMVSFLYPFVHTDNWISNKNAQKWKLHLDNWNLNKTRYFLHVLNVHLALLNGIRCLRCILCTWDRIPSPTLDMWYFVYFLSSLTMDYSTSENYFEINDRVNTDGRMHFVVALILHYQYFLFPHKKSLSLNFNSCKFKEKCAENLYLTYCRTGLSNIRMVFEMKCNKSKDKMNIRIFEYSLMSTSFKNII